MKVKSCYLSRMIESEEALKEYTEELGCTIRHRLNVVPGAVAYTIEDAMGNKSVLFTLPAELQATARSKIGARLVVDDIQEAIDFYLKKGYDFIMQPVETESTIICAMTTDTDFKVIFKHKKKD